MKSYLHVVIPCIIMLCRAHQMRCRLTKGRNPSQLYKDFGSTKRIFTHKKNLHMLRKKKEKEGEERKKREAEVCVCARTYVYVYVHKKEKDRGSKMRKRMRKIDNLQICGGSYFDSQLGHMWS